MLLPEGRKCGDSRSRALQALPLTAFLARAEKEGRRIRGVRIGMAENTHPLRAQNAVPLFPARASLRRTEANSTLPRAIAGHATLQILAGAPARSARTLHALPFYSKLSVVRTRCAMVASLVSKTLAKSTKSRAACKQRKSSEALRIFPLMFHRKLYSCRQSCVREPSGLLKECESSQEKPHFCCGSSAIQKQIFVQCRDCLPGNPPSLRPRAHRKAGPPV